MKSLNEVTEIVGLSRRMIQEYEKSGLATTPITTNKYGHLLYDEDHIQHLWVLRFYKELGYKTADIRKILADPDYDIHKALSYQITALEKKKEDIVNLISVANALNELELSPNAILGDVTGFTDLSYDDIISIWGTAFNIIFSIEKTEDIPESLITEEDLENCFDAIDQIMDDFKNKLKYDSSPVQKEIHAIHANLAKLISDSVLAFSWGIAYFAPGSQGAKDIEEDYGLGSSEFFYRALTSYCAAHTDNPTDNRFFSALENIANLGRKKYTAYSDEVQSQVANIHEFFIGIPMFNSKDQLAMLRYGVEICRSKPLKKLVDNGAERGLCWFISKSMEVYCQNYYIDTKGEKHE